VGKRSLTCGLRDNRAAERHTASIGVQISKKEVFVANQNVTMMVWSVTDLDYRDAMLMNYSRGMSGYLLVADGTRPSTLERAREISPQSSVLATAVANVLFFAGRYDDAIKQCQKALDLDFGAVAAHTVLRWAYEKKGMHSEALAASQFPLKVIERMIVSRLLFQTCCLLFAPATPTSQSHGEANA